MRGKLHSLAQGVNDPTENELACGPTAIPFQELLEGDGFLTVRLIGHGLGQD